MADLALSFQPCSVQNASQLELLELLSSLRSLNEHWTVYWTTVCENITWILPGVKVASPQIWFFLIVIYFVYVKAFKPMNSIKDLTDVGFKHLGSTKGRGSIVSRSRKNRLLGTKLPPPYPNGWYGVVESRALDIGQVVGVDCFGENLVVFRADDGISHCVDAYCPHLGANMAAGGAVRGSCIECPFHRWRFSGQTGECVHIPGTEKVPRGISVRKWSCVEMDGMVFVWYDGPSKCSTMESPPSWQLPRLEPISSGRWGYRGRNEFIVNCHIQDIPENGADVAHLNAVHGATILVGGDIGNTNGRFTDIFGRHVWSATWAPSNTHSHIAEMQLNHDIKIIGKFAIVGMNVTATQIGPAYVQLDLQTTLGPLVIVQTILPVGPMTQKVIHRIYAPWYMALYANLMIYGEGIMFERDVMVWNNKKYISNPSYVKTDKTIRTFRSWYSQFYTDDSISFDDASSGSGKCSPLDW